MEVLSSLKAMSMTSNIVQQFTSLGVQVIVALLAWNYYKRKTSPLAARYSTFGPHFWTGSVDACILWPVGFVTVILLTLNIPRIFAASLVALESFTWLMYTVLMHARYGQTVGKMVTKVRVVDYRTEGKISFRQAWLREGIPMALSLGLVGYEIFAILAGKWALGAVANGQAFLGSKAFWLLTSLPGLWFVAEVLTMLTNEKRRALHDFISGTVVIRTNCEGASSQRDGFPNPGAAGGILPV
jgi:uncharacterized RDD family membrane protein YckC